MAAVKELSAQWLVNMAEYMYIADDPWFLVNGLRHAGISNALSGSEHMGKNSGEDSNILSVDEYILMKTSHFTLIHLYGTIVTNS